MTTELEIETLVSELLLHTRDFLGKEKAEKWEEDPLLYSIVAGFLSNLAIYKDYRDLMVSALAAKDLFEFKKEMPT